MDKGIGLLFFLFTYTIDIPEQIIWINKSAARHTKCYMVIKRWNMLQSCRASPK